MCGWPNKNITADFLFHLLSDSTMAVVCQNSPVLVLIFLSKFFWFPVSGQFFDDYTSDTEYKGKFIGALNSYHHQASSILKQNKMKIEKFHKSEKGISLTQLEFFLNIVIIMQQYTI